MNSYDHIQEGPLTADEKRRLFMTLDDHTGKLAEQGEQNEAIIKKVDKLELAAYGDEHLQVKGTIKSIVEIEKFIASIKLAKAKWAGIGLVIAALAKMAWDWALEHFSGGKH